MATITGELYLCECCALKLANDDESSCTGYYGHEAHALQSMNLQSPRLVLSGNEREWQDRYAWYCDGCDQANAYGSIKYEAVIFELDNVGE